MGKAQSKRSVDITTEPKKGDEEVTGKLEKIEDGDRKQLNGDASTSPESDAEKKQSGEETENDKDASTEKSVENGGGDSATPTQDDQKNGSESPIEESATKNTTAAVEDISPLSDESAKKTKKEKVKKKWSFRSISFGKKDKQKPAKTEELVAATPTDSTVLDSTNGEAEKTSTNDNAGDVSAEIKPVENGNASEKELNGQNTPLSNDEKTKVNDAEITEMENNDNTGNTTNVESTTPTANISNQTEKTTAAVAVADAVVTVSNAVNQAVAIVSESITEAVEKVVPILSNGDAPTSETIKNGDIHETNDETTASEKADSTSITLIKSIPIVNNGDEVPHQNGTNLDEHVEEQNNKSQTEVNTKPTNITSQQTLSQKSLSQSQQTPQSPSPSIKDLLPSDSTSSNLSMQSNKFVAMEIEENNANISEAVTISSANTSTTNKPLEVVEQQQKQLEDGIESVEPPPLPNSPPPSQVTVFAFNNTIETDEIPIPQPTVMIHVSNEVAIELQNETNNKVVLDDNLKTKEVIEIFNTENKIIVDDTIKNDISDAEVNAVIDSIANLANECLTTANSMSNELIENISHIDLNDHNVEIFSENETVLNKDSDNVENRYEKVQQEESIENLIQTVENIKKKDQCAEKNSQINLPCAAGEKKENIDIFEGSSDIISLQKEISDVEDINCSDNSKSVDSDLSSPIIEIIQPITESQNTGNCSLSIAIQKDTEEKAHISAVGNEQSSTASDGESTNETVVIEQQEMCAFTSSTDKTKVEDFEPGEAKLDSVSSITLTNKTSYEFIEKSTQFTDDNEQNNDQKLQQSEIKTNTSDQVNINDNKKDQLVTDEESHNDAAEVTNIEVIEILLGTTEKQENDTATTNVIESKVLNKCIEDDTNVDEIDLYGISVEQFRSSVDNRPVATTDELLQELLEDN